MNPKQLFKQAAQTADECVSRVEQSQLDAPTPCRDWNLGQLVNHLVYEVSWAPDLLAGKTIAEVGTMYDGDLLDGDAAHAWRKALAAAQAAVDTADPEAIVHLSYGDVSARHYIQELAGDVLIHGWDVGQALSCLVVFDKQLAQTVYDVVQPRAAEFAQSGLFDAPLSTNEDDAIQTKLLAFFGRSPEAWQSAN